MNLALRIAAIVLFIIAGLIYVGWIGTLQAAALVAFGLATWCGSTLTS